MDSIRTIVCPTDFSAASDRELELAAQLCHRLEAKLVLQHNISDLGERRCEWLEPEWLGAGGPRRRLASLIRRLPDAAADGSRAVVTHGRLTETISHVVEDVGADLVVMGSHARAHADRRSETERLIERAPCPVLTTHEASPQTWLPHLDQTGRLRAVVPVDFDPRSMRALEYALALRRILPLELIALYVVEDPDRGASWARDRLDEVVPEDRRDEVTLDVSYGDPVEALLLEESFLRAQLVVMGSHHRSWLEKIFSRRTPKGHELVHRSLCPVLFVPEPASA